VPIGGCSTTSNPCGGSDAGTPTDSASVKCPCTQIQTAKIVSVQFMSDHQVIKKHTADWTDGGFHFDGPEWTSWAQYPVSYTMGTPVELLVKCEVLPTNTCPVKGALLGKGPGGLEFKSPKLTLYPGDNLLTLKSSGKLDKKVRALDFEIQWRTEGLGVAVSPSRTSHKMYVTYGTPHGGGYTEKRLAYLCQTCSGRSKLTQSSSADELGIAEAIFEAWRSSPPTFRLSEPKLPADLWLLMSSVSYQGQCIDLAKLMKKAIELLGGEATIGYVYGSTDTDCFETSSDKHKTRRCPGGAHGTEVIMVWSAGDWNNWEAVCKVESICYAIKVHKGTPIQILRKWLSDRRNYQAWVHWDQVTQSLQACRSPGPFPVPAP